MERNGWADRFTDNVIRRTERDICMSVYVVLLLLVLPPVAAAVFCPLIIEINHDIFVDGSDLAIAVVTAMVGECCMASFLLFSMNRAGRKHQSRDLEWMDALIGYVESKGGDTTEMHEVRDRIRMTGWKVKGAFSGFMLLLGLILLLATGLFMYLGIDVISENVRVLVVVSYVLLLIQLVFTMSTTIRFPYRHDKAQCLFTEALSTQLRHIGIPTEPMKRSIHRRFMVVHIILFVVTLGLYSSVLLMLTIHRLNVHIRKQWKYEERLMADIIEFEGGVGVEGIGFNQPRNAAARFLKNTMRSRMLRPYQVTLNKKAVSQLCPHLAQTG